MDKHDLLNEFFTLKGNYEIKKVDDIYKKLSRYIEEVEDDPQVKDIICIIHMWSCESSIMGSNKHRSTIYEIITLLIDRLADKNTWDLYDTGTLAHMLAYAKTYKQTLKLAKRALLELEDFVDDYSKYCVVIKLVVHINVLLRLLRAKFAEVKDAHEMDKLKEMFVFHYEAALELCSSDKKSFAISLEIITMRLKIFLAENDAIASAYSLPASIKIPELHRLFENEISGYEFLAREAAEIHLKK